MIILGIETSCDETAASVVTDKRDILSNIVLSQQKEHAVFGGVVPEVAARAHLEHIDNIIKAAMQDANIRFSELDAVAATCGPGLIGGVIIGMMSAKAIAAAQNIPFIAVNHLEGHALTPRLTDDIEFPYLLLLVSGGHSQLLVVEGVGQYKRLGTTLDDAAGECFDKSAKLMGLPFPGGAHLEQYAKNCADPIAAAQKYPLPSPLKGQKNCDFSFSGLKTAVRNYIMNMPTGQMNPQDIADLAHAFQEKMANVMTDRCAHAISIFLKDYGHKTTTPTLVVSGGVSANLVIRNRLKLLAEKNTIRLIAPPLNLCGDNAAMIAWAGIEKYRLGQTDPLDFAARPRWPLDPTAEKKIGAGVKA